METLPVDLITDIFLRLPAKTLIRFKVVCKLWYSLITDYHFVDRHLERSIATKTNLHFVITAPKLHLVDFDTFENPVELNYPFKNHNNGGVMVVGSCNGLLCLTVCVRDYYLQYLMIYNPTTQTHKLTPYLPIPEPLFYPHGSFDFDFGFGFDSFYHDYKCVRIGQSFDKKTGTSYCEVMVYSLSDDCWRRGPNVPYYLYIHRGSSALLNEILHWVGTGQDNDHVPQPIVTFNVRDESFSSLSLPDFNVEHHISVNVGVLDESLFVLISYVYDYDVWIMKEYGVAGSWKKVFNVVKNQPIEHLERIISYSRSGNELFVLICLFQVAYIDLKTMETTIAKVADFVSCSDAHLCVENLLMLDIADHYSLEEEQPGKKKSKKKGKKKSKKKRNRKGNSRHWY